MEWTDPPYICRPHPLHYLFKCTTFVVAFGVLAMVMSYINQKMQLSQPPVSGMTADIHELQKELQRMRNLLQAKETEGAERTDTQRLGVIGAFTVGGRPEQELAERAQLAGAGYEMPGAGAATTAHGTASDASRSTATQGSTADTTRITGEASKATMDGSTAERAGSTYGDIPMDAAKEGRVQGESSAASRTSKEETAEDGKSAGAGVARHDAATGRRTEFESAGMQAGTLMKGKSSEESKTIDRPDGITDEDRVATATIKTGGDFLNADGLSKDKRPDFRAPPAPSVLEGPSGGGSEHVIFGTPNKYPSSIGDALEQYSADKTGKIDFALESAGGAIVDIGSTENYFNYARVSLLGFTICEGANGPRAMIQASVLPGECWAFKGSSGYAVIRLLGRVFVTGVSLEHIAKNMSPTGEISTAPKDFSILGLSGPNAKTGVTLGKFQYSGDGPTIQFFPVEKSDKSYQYIKFAVHSNYGNKDYTCVYRLRVHGSLDHPPRTMV